jgi:hypothetical protein
MPVRKYTDDKERCREWRKIHPDYMKKKRSTFGYRMSAWRSHARERNLEFSVSEGEIKKLPLICHYTGTPLTMEVGHDNTVSLDRVNSKLGYVPGNVTFCTRWINLMKKDRTVEEFVKMCQKVVTYCGTKIQFDNVQ